MKGLLLFVLASILLSSVAASYSSSVPLFIFSGQKQFSRGNNDHVTESNVVHSQDFSSLLSKLTTNYGSSELLSSSSTPPQVIVAFINQQMSSASGSQSSGAYSSHARPSALKAALASSSSSLAVPFLSLSGAMTSSLIQQSLTSTQHTSLSMDSMSCDQVADSIRSSVSSTQSLYLVRSSDAARTEACLSTITSMMRELVDDRFVIMLSADSAPSHTNVPSFRSHHAPSFTTQSLLSTMSLDSGMNGRFLVAADNSTSVSVGDDVDTGPLYITPAILIGILVVAFLLIIFFVGICCTMSIQAPLRFATPSQKLVIGKEY